MGWQTLIAEVSTVSAAQIDHFGTVPGQLNPAMMFGNVGMVDYHVVIHGPADDDRRSRIEG